MYRNEDRKIPQTGFANSSFTAATGSNLSYFAAPPDLSGISDPNVVVSFKNLLKKDTITKVKGLEALATFATAHSEDQDTAVDQATLDSWTQLYPRLSIDSARRVRELSHQLLDTLLRITQRRLEPFLSRIVPAWLAGAQDHDKAVARAASQGLDRLLTSPEKKVHLWRRSRARILTYISEALAETRETLSDERGTSVDEMDAKYWRVIGGALALLGGVIGSLKAGESLGDDLDALLTREQVWKGVTSTDATVRKAACRLLCLFLEKRGTEELHDLVPLLKKLFIVQGLHASQNRSAVEFVRALYKLTERYPSIWLPTEKKVEKKTPAVRLFSFVEKGSQASPGGVFWDSLHALLVSLPVEVLSADAVARVLAAIRAALCSKDEPRNHAVFGWMCYIRTARVLMEHDAIEVDRVDLAQKAFFPLFEQYLFPSAENTQWNIPGNPLTILPLAHNFLTESTHSPLLAATGQELERLSSILCGHLANSLPEISADSAKSQDAVADEGQRWFAFVSSAFKSRPERSSHSSLVSPSREIIAQSTRLLRARNFKPYGSAIIIDNVCQQEPVFLEEHDDEPALIPSFLRSIGADDMPALLESRSTLQLLNCLHILGGIPDQKINYETVWCSWTSALLALPASNARISAITTLVSHPNSRSLSLSNDALQEWLGQSCIECVTGTDDGQLWDLFETATSSGVMSDDNLARLSAAIVKHLEGTDDVASGIRGLHIIATYRPGSISRSDELHTTLLASILRLMDTQDETITNRLDSIRAALNSQTSGREPLISVVVNNLENAGPRVLPVRTLVSQALAAASSPTVSTQDLFPSAKAWIAGLEFVFRQDINAAVNMHEAFATTYCLLSQKPKSGDGAVPEIVVDRDDLGMSVSARMALFSCQLLTELEAAGQHVDQLSLSEPFLVELIRALVVTSAVINNQVSTGDKNKLWYDLSDSENEALSVVSCTTAIVKRICAKGSISMLDPNSTGLLHELYWLLAENAKGISQWSLYHAQALTNLIATLVDAHHGLSLPDADQQLQNSLSNWKFPTPESAPLVLALLTGWNSLLGSSKIIASLTNNITSELTAANAEDLDKTLLLTVVFRACLRVYDDVGASLPIAANRIVFLVRQLTRWTDTETTMSPHLAAQLCACLAAVLPHIKNVYGAHWEKSIEFCIATWTRISNTSAIMSSADLIAAYRALQLYQAIEELVVKKESESEDDQTCDDVMEALELYADNKSQALIDLLKCPRGEEPTTSAPAQLLDSSLLMELDKVPTGQIHGIVSLSPFLASSSSSIQNLAWRLSSKSVASQQEQRSLEILLDKSDTQAQLPAELISPLHNPPHVDDMDDDAQLSGFPTRVRAYLLGWLVVFAAFPQASHRLKGDYSEHIKSENILTPLLNLTADILGHSDGNSLKPEAIGLNTNLIKDYNPEVDGGSTAHDIKRLVVHLYYLVLKYLPALFRNWSLFLTDKQTRSTLSSWTARYISPLIVNEMLDEILIWASDQEKSIDAASDEKALAVKVSRSVREVTAGYEIDDRMASILIRIPAEYPLIGVMVEGLSRCGANEKKWQSWLMATRGMIMFSNGSIIDGLIAFRRNVIGALEGQSECAICYSIIAEDGRIPDKRCTICKHLFHRHCIFKWFQSSGQNTCPLCRNPIDIERTGRRINARVI